MWVCMPDGSLRNGRNSGAIRAIKPLLSASTLRQSEKKNVKYFVQQMNGLALRLRSLVFQGETGFEYDLIVPDLAILNVAAGLDDLEPV
jgi:hypothetical protein